MHHLIQKFSCSYKRNLKTLKKEQYSNFNATETMIKIMYKEAACFTGESFALISGDQSPWATGNNTHRNKPIPRRFILFHWSIVTHSVSIYHVLTSFTINLLFLYGKCRFAHKKFFFSFLVNLMLHTIPIQVNGSGHKF